MSDNTYGKYYDAANAGAVFNGSVSAVTVPVIAANLVSVFTLFNPAGSGKLMVPLCFELGIVLATTVVNDVNLYGQAAHGSTNAALASVTEVTPVNAKFGAGQASVCKLYSAATFTGTPSRIGKLFTFGAVTAAQVAMLTKDMDGRLILPPGASCAVAMSTAAGTSSGLALACTWAEIPA